MEVRGSVEKGQSGGGGGVVKFLEGKGMEERSASLPCRHPSS